MDDLPSPPRYNLAIGYFFILTSLMAFVVLSQTYNNYNDIAETENSYNFNNIELIGFKLSKDSKSHIISGRKILLIRFLVLFCYIFKIYIYIIIIEYIGFKTKLNNYNYLNIHSPPLNIK